MKKFTAFVAILISICLAGESISGEPTIDETSHFIYEKTSMNWTDKNGCRYKMTYFSDDNKDLCNTAQYEVVDCSCPDQNTIKKILYKIRFKELDPTRLDIGDDWVKAVCINDKDCIKIEESKNKIRYSKSIYFDVHDRRNAEQVMKAVRHMIEKCGGKGELF